MNPHCNGRQPFSTRVDAAVQDRVRLNVLNMTRVDPAFTLAAFVEALDRHCAQTEQQHNDGAPWDGDGPVSLRPGRRVQEPASLRVDPHYPDPHADPARHLDGLS